MEGAVVKPGRTITVTEGRAYALDEGREKLIATMGATLIISAGEHTAPKRTQRQHAATGLNFGLGEDLEALRDTVHAFAQAEIAPRAAEIDRSDQFPMDLWRKMGEGVLGITVPEEYGGANMGYLAHMLAMEEISRASASVGFVLRRAQQPVRQPDQAQRQPGAEEEVPAQADFRRARGRAGHERARRRQRRDLHEAEGRGQGRLLPAQRQQDVDHQRPRRRHAGGLCQDRARAGRARRHRLPDREGHEGLFHRAEAGQAGHARQPHRRAGVPERRRCRRKTPRSTAAPRCS